MATSAKTSRENKYFLKCDYFAIVPFCTRLISLTRWNGCENIVELPEEERRENEEIGMKKQ